MTTPIRFNFVDFNTYGVVVAPDKKERTALLREFLARDVNGDGQPDAEVAALQELFSPSQRCRIRRWFNSHPHKYIPRELDWKLSSSGLGLLSRYPVVARHFMPFPDYLAADWDQLANKGIAHVRIKHPELGLIDIFDTHTQAAYDNTQEYFDIRAQQFVTAKLFVRKHADPNRLAILAGDLNMVRGSEEAEIFNLLFRDFTDVLAQKFPDGVPPTRRHDNPYVCDAPQDCDEEDLALDYVFVRPPASMDLDIAQTTVEYIDEFDGRPISDHDGLAIDLALTGEPPSRPERQRRILFWRKKSS